MKNHYLIKNKFGKYGLSIISNIENRERSEFQLFCYLIETIKIEENKITNIIDSIYQYLELNKFSETDIKEIRDRHLVYD